MMLDANQAMQVALSLAQKAAKQDEVPVGAVIINSQNQVIAAAHNQTETLQDPTAHAECLVISQACAALGQKYLSDCTLAVTLEPCAMCAGAIAHARLKRIIYGAADPKSGGTHHGAHVFSHAQTHHQPEIIAGILETECRILLQTYFAVKR